MTSAHTGDTSPGNPDDWSPVNLTKGDQASSADPAAPTPPPGYIAPQSVAPQPTAPQPPVYGNPAPPPAYAPQPPAYGYPAPSTPDPYAAAYGYPAYPVQNSGNDSLAVASLVCGLISLTCCLPGPIALILGIVSLRNNPASTASGSNRGMAIAGIALGSISTLILLVYIVAVVVGAASGV